jgi:hypothetical protein
MATPAQTTVPLHAARGRLAVLWTIGSGVIVFILIAQSLGNVYHQRVAEVWASVALMFAPALLLVIIASAADALKPIGATGGPCVHRTFYLVAFCLSAANLFLIVGTIACEPIAVYLHPDDGFAPADVLRASMLWMIPFHIIVLGVVAILFSTRAIRPGTNPDKNLKSIEKFVSDATESEQTGHPPPQVGAVMLQPAGPGGANVIMPGSDSSGGVTQERGLLEAAAMWERYIDFDLHVARGGTVTANSPEGDATAQISATVPNSVGLTLSLIEERQTNTELLKQFGQELYNWLLPASIHTHLQQTEARARGEKSKLRIRLRIEDGDIARLPLEFLYRAIGGYYLAVNPDTALSRYLNLPLPADRLRGREGPLHLLAIIADPSDQIRLPPDEWETLLREALAAPLAQRLLELEMVKRATRKEIRDALLRKKPDIIQFVGHGVYTAGKGHIALVDDQTGRTWLVDDERFANIFLGSNEHLGLVCLATCESARSDDPQGFLGIAPQLVQRGLPTVVAMQYGVYVKTARVFLEDFYASVAARKPIDWATQSARNAISLEFGLDNREFATPVLYMRAGDGEVF